jgi:uncharacterized membrane protein
MAASMRTSATSNCAGQTSREPRAINMSAKERIATTSTGVALMLLGLRARGKPRLLAEVVGALLVRRGWTGHCTVYRWLGVSTADRDVRSQPRAPDQRGVRVDKSLQIDAYPAEIYRFWRRLENLPRFLRHLESVRQLDTRRSEWSAQGILSQPIEWTAEIINERENELIAWQSLPGSAVETAGSVHFERLPNGHGTLVHLQLKYDPAGGRSAIKLAEMLGANAETAIEEDLVELKRILERCEPVDRPASKSLGAPKPR